MQTAFLRRVQNAIRILSIPPSVNIGSRTPVPNAPAWVTLEVIHGGFASGSYAAAIGPGEVTSRAYLMSADGVRELVEQLYSGDYVLKHPENAALLVVAALLGAIGSDSESGDDGSSGSSNSNSGSHNRQLLTELMAEITPFLDTLRLHPYPIEPKTAKQTEQQGMQTVHAAELATGLLYLQPVLTSVDQLKKRSAVVVVGHPNAAPSSHVHPRLRKLQLNANWNLQALPLEVAAVRLVQRTYAAPGGYPFQTPNLSDDDEWWAEAARIVAAFDALLSENGGANVSLRMKNSSALAVIVNKALRPCLAAGKKSTVGVMDGKTIGFVKRHVQGFLAKINRKNDNGQRIGASSAAAASHTAVSFDLDVASAPHLQRAVASAPRADAFVHCAVLAARLEHYIELCGKQSAVGPLECAFECFLAPVSADEMAAAVAELGLVGERHEGMQRLRMERTANLALLKKQKTATSTSPSNSSASSSLSPCCSPAAKILLRCMEMTLPELLERRVIRSTSQVGRIIEPIVAKVAVSSQNLPAELRRLAERIVLAFRKRRSLLLLNYESQVRVQELPWYSALAKINRSDDAARRSSSSSSNRGAAASVAAAISEQARSEAVAVAAAVARDVLATTIENLPQQPLANELVSALNMIHRSARGTTAVSGPTPFVAEIAADIFMGGFSETFESASHAAASVLRGTLWELYFHIDYSLLQLTLPQRQQHVSRGRGGALPPAMALSALDVCRSALLQKYVALGAAGNVHNHVLGNRRTIELVTHHVGQSGCVCTAARRRQLQGVLQPAACAAAV